jgi:hypothetical protein
MAGPVAQ